MEIRLENLSKRYTYQWIVKDVNLTFTTKYIYGVSGDNGSGKSTLLKLISGYLSPSKGKLIYKYNGDSILITQFYKYLSMVAPYSDIIQEYTMKEMFYFHQKFKPFKKSVTYEDFQNLIQLKDQKDKQIQFFSSGMKQKLQLALAILSDTKILLLDEPTAYLDENAKLLFKNLLLGNTKDRIIIISSNDPYDLSLCDKIINLADLQ